MILQPPIIEPSDTVGHAREGTLPAPLPLEERIAKAAIPHQSKQLARELLTVNRTVGFDFSVSMAKARKMCHAATNLDVIKHLRKLHHAGLIDYEFDSTNQRVIVRFLESE